VAARAFLIRSATFQSVPLMLRVWSTIHERLTETRYAYSFAP